MTRDEVIQWYRDEEAYLNERGLKLGAVTISRAPDDSREVIGYNMLNYDKNTKQQKKLEPQAEVSTNEITERIDHGRGFRPHFGS